MNRIKKALSRLLVMLLIAALVGVTPAMAVAPITPTEVEMTASSEEADEFTWYYRTVDGITQKRLFNNTRNMWVTDWTDV